MLWLLLVWYSAIKVVTAYTAYSKDHLAAFFGTLPSLDVLNKDTGSFLTPLLVPRVSGTQGATDVFNWLHDFFAHNMTGWKVEEDRFVAQTPLQEVEFVNLIVTMDPPGVEEDEVTRLVLAAHYDSKMLPPGFIGATDSSVPCAMLLYLAQTLSSRLPFFWESSYWDGVDNIEVPTGIQLIFFDGEEAVKDWTDEDSIYGARHLAERWAAEYTSPSATSSRRSKLQSIELLVLLDLLGHAETTISSYFKTTHWAYSHLAFIEELLRETKIAKNNQFNHVFAGDRQYFEAAGQIGDDHIPFMQRGIEVLHLIPIPFPPVWHTMDDDAAHLDQASIDDMTLILSAFTCQWLNLPASPQLQKEHVYDRGAIDEL